MRDLVRGIGDDRVAETLDRSGLGNNEWLIRQLAIHADRRAAKAAERGETEKRGEGETTGETGSPYRDLAYRPNESDGGAGRIGKSSPFVEIADKSDSGRQFAETATGNSTR